MTDKVSIIIPIYNVEAFVGKCIESVILQTYENIEIILVIDGSVDNSLYICEEYAKKDMRIKIIQKENGGLSSARNLGIDIATGTYIFFLDGDDWIEKNCIEYCIENKNNSEIVIFSFIREYRNKSKSIHLFESECIEFTGTELTNLVRRMVGPITSEMRNPHRIEDMNPVWNKLYLHELIKNIRYTDTQIIGTEDLWFNLQVFNKASKIIYLDKSLYHYRKYNEFSLTRKYNDKLFPRWKNLYLYIDKYIDKNWNSQSVYKKALSNRIIINLLALVRNIASSELTLGQKVNELKELLNDEIYKLVFSEFEFGYLPVHWRIFYKACRDKNIFLIYLIIKIAEAMKKNVK